MDETGNGRADAATTGETEATKPRVLMVGDVTDHAAMAHVLGRHRMSKALATRPALTEPPADAAPVPDVTVMGELYVDDVRGNDHAPGTKDRPLRSMGEANRRAARSGKPTHIHLVQYTNGGQALNRAARRRSRKMVARAAR